MENKAIHFLLLKDCNSESHKTYFSVIRRYMADISKFTSTIEQGYTFKGDFIVLGGAMLDGQNVPETLVKAPLSTFNRHGLIAGATGTGKTKTLQGIAEQLSQKGVSVLLMDVKGDLSGIAVPGTSNPKIEERHSKLGIPWNPMNNPCELLSISDEPGTKMRATVSEFGPVLLSKILELNDVQSGTVSLLFKYCDDNKLPLLDIADLRKALQYISQEGKDEIEKNYGLVSTTSVGAIMRNIIRIEEQGANQFFGEPSFDVDDLIRLDANGHGMVNILRLTDIQGKPQLFSTFMLCLMAEIYAAMPERGDVAAPELVIFIDEAHLIFKDATKELLNQIETVVKLIRSKGIGLFFITQNPADIPDEVLGQLGFKLQHALRAFTAKDRKDITKAAENYPLTDFYKTEDLITQLGIGEALVTVLNEKGIPTPLVHTMLCAPGSRMDVLTADEINKLQRSSQITAKYEQALDRDSAFEILSKKLEDLSKDQAEEKEDQDKPRAREEKSFVEKAVNSSVGRTIVRELTRGLLGVLGLSSTRRRSRKSLF
jgi:DNA helicase HerA-like ATPase